MIDTTQGMAQPERARFLKERFLSRRPSICLEGALAKRARSGKRKAKPSSYGGPRDSDGIAKQDHRHRSP